MKTLTEYFYEQQIEEGKIENIKKIFNSIKSLKSLSDSKDESQLESFINDLKNDYGEYLNVDEDESDNDVKKYIIKFTKNKLEDAEFVLAVKSGKWQIAVKKGGDLLKRIGGMWKKSIDEIKKIINPNEEMTVSERTVEGIKFYFKSLIDYAAV